MFLFKCRRNDERERERNVSKNKDRFPEILNLAINICRIYLSSVRRVSYPSAPAFAWEIETL